MYRLKVRDAISGNLYDITNLASEIEYTTELEGQAGKLTFILPQDPLENLVLTNGSNVVFLNDDVGIFYGYVFTLGTDATDDYKVTCYDQLRYWKNEEVYITKNQTASEIFEKICIENKIKYEIVTPTTYVPEPYVHSKKTLYQIVERGLQLANIAQNKQYFIKDNYGTLQWTELMQEKTNLILGDGSLVIDYAYEISIDSDTANNIKFTRNNEATGKIDSWIIKDSATQQRWGKLQFLQEVDESVSDAAIQDLGLKLLRLKNRETKTLKLEALGIDGLYAGSGFTIKLDKLGINEAMWVKSATHNYSKDIHTMSLEVFV